MAVNIASNKISQGSHTFNLGLPFSIPGYTDALYHDSNIPDTWQVTLITPEGIRLVKTSGISFPVPEQPLIFFPIASGDLDKTGIYHYQITKTTNGSRINSEVSNFTVEGSVPSLTF